MVGADEDAIGAMKTRSRCMWEVSAMCAAAMLFGDMAQAAPHIRIKGRAQIDVRLSRESGALVLVGAVLDDLARPLSEARVGVTIEPASGRQSTPMAPLFVAPETCHGIGSSAEVDGPGSLILQADRGGRFCAGLKLGAGGVGATYVAKIETQASALVDGTKIELPVDLRLPPLTLRFDPEAAAPQPFWLDDETVSLQAVASTEDEGVTSPAAGIALSLSNEAGESLASATTDSSGRARFRMDPIRLGAPGAGEVRVSFAGDETVGASTHAMRIERRTRVDLVAAHGAQRTAPISWLDDDVTVRIVATPRCARRGCKGTPSGTVEARIDGEQIVAAAPLSGGVARLVIASDVPSPHPSAGGGNTRAIIRYVPDAPWFQPASELVLPQTPRGTSPWGRVPLALAAIAVIAWLAFARLPIRSAGRAQPHVLAQVRLVRPAPRSHGWTGLVIDAHDGVTVPGARIAIERGGFDGVEVLAQTYSDANGAFSLPIGESQSRVELVAEGPMHAKLRRPLPSPGELAVALVLRKRALLDRFVAWARHWGTFYDTAADPTPRQVQQTAGADLAVVRWASAVELAVYGGGVVDERAQAHVDSLAPPSPADDVDGTHPRSL
jgi:hypothetical protein